MRHRLIPEDTTLEVARVQFTVLRNMGTVGRAKATFELNDTIRLLAEEGIRKRHPEYDDKAVRLALIRLSVSREVFQRLIPGVEAPP